MASASQIRPFKLIEAFQQSGYEVAVVEGSGKERQQQIAKIKTHIKQGMHYDFVYSESSVMPTLLTEKHHFPTYPCLDFSFLSFCKKHHIPIGLFYRDIYWCYINKGKDWKQRIAKYFYQYDLFKYKQLLDVLFLPSLEMLPYIPFKFNKEVQSLPAGALVSQLPEPKQNGKLKLLYIGGLGGYYHIAQLLKVVSELPFVALTICCRKAEWEQMKAEYSSFLNNQITILHASGDTIKELYAQADVFTLLLKPNDYLNFAVSYKLFEAIGYQRPLLGYAGTWSGNFIMKNHIGITCYYSEESLKEALISLHEQPELIHSFKENLKTISKENSWESRCLQIANALVKS
ncbi:MAG: glycosyl transferase family 1 [Bacteroidales bacterium]